MWSTAVPKVFWFLNQQFLLINTKGAGWTLHWFSLSQLPFKKRAKVTKSNSAEYDIGVEDFGRIPYEMYLSHSRISKNISNYELLDGLNVQTIYEIRKDTLLCLSSTTK